MNSAGYNGGARMIAELTVITMNCLGLPLPVPGLRRRLQALGKALAATGAHLACLQEVGRWRHLGLLRQDERSWPYALAVAYPYAPKGGLVTLARIPALAPDYHAFREWSSPINMNTPERFQGKGVLQTCVQVGEHSVVVLNTHLAANYSARWTHTNRYARVERAQLKEIAAIVRAVPLDTIVVVAGDFNVPRGSWLYHEFLAATGLRDPLEASTEPTYRPLPGMPERAAQAIDHVLVRTPKELDVTSSSELCFHEPAPLAHGVLGYLSDHLGVRLTLRW